MAKRERQQADIKDLEADFEAFRKQQGIPLKTWNMLTPKQKIKLMIDEALGRD